MLKAILIDDELDSLESLAMELKAYCPALTVVGSYSDPREGRKALLENQPDILFLDIEMPHLNGFELLESLAKINFEVIFVTAYDEFAIRAFEFNATDYLLKPIMKSKLIQAVQKIEDQKNNHVDHEDLKALVQNIQLQRGLENIALPTTDGFEFIHVNDIAFLKSESNYTWVHLTNKQKHLMSKTLKEVSQMVRFPQFFRSHQSYLVNLNYVKKYVRGNGGYLVLKDKTQIPVSRANKDSLMKILQA